MTDKQTFTTDDMCPECDHPIGAHGRPSGCTRCVWRDITGRYVYDHERYTDCPAVFAPLLVRIDPR